MKKKLNVLKKAILMERKGHAFYSKIAEQSDNEDIKELFQIMASEELLHIKFLSKAYLHAKNTNKFELSDLPEQGDNEFTDEILSAKIKNKLSVAGFEAAAISAAIDMENRAVDVYSKNYENATDKNEKELFRWLAEWEMEHHKVLFELELDLKEKAMNEEEFPFLLF